MDMPSFLYSILDGMADLADPWNSLAPLPFKILSRFPEFIPPPEIDICLLDIYSSNQTQPNTWVDPN